MIEKKPVPKHKVALRGGFSDRMGIKSENTTIQTNEFDSRTRTQIMNTLSGIIAERYGSFGSNNITQKLVVSVLSDVYQFEIDRSVSYGIDQILILASETIRLDSYDAILTLVEYLCQQISKDNNDTGKVYSQFNDLFEKEYVGYRFISGHITPITNTNEQKEIETALNNASENAKSHFQKALDMLSDRVSPDYENSIKESISAVEAECSLIVGKPSILSDALKQLNQYGITIHPALKEAFIKLYAYTSDGKGIRHAGDLGGRDATFAEAKFMLTACSAFINYLKANIAD